MEMMRIAPKGTASTAHMLAATGDALAASGESGIFTPMVSAAQRCARQHSLAHLQLATTVRDLVLTRVSLASCLVCVCLQFFFLARKPLKGEAAKDSPASSKKGSKKK